MKMLTCCGCLYAAFFRAKLRAQYRLPEKPAADWLVHCICEPCALTQEYRELQRRGFDPSIGPLSLLLSIHHVLPISDVSQNSKLGRNTQSDQVHLELAGKLGKREASAHHASCCGTRDDEIAASKWASYMYACGTNNNIVMDFDPSSCGKRINTKKLCYGERKGLAYLIGLPLLDIYFYLIQYPAG
ncbi:hypothetical protein EJ110_NYTH08476 [Nymphaea thermarum]|nr:hypothetical protein EJ110_NYTH08476 [Nymphaea thermarum]